MCGIAGVIAADEVRVRSALAGMVAAQAHRGPDDQGVSIVPFGRACLGLGHRRLSILDLSPLGHEPMVHPRTRDQLIFNGEIYNFRELRQELELMGVVFQSHCDAEVLLHAIAEWGTGAVSKLRGMFAFAYFDVRQQRLLLARDSIGIKPFYIADLADGSVVFASEVRAILASGLVEREPDVRGVAGILAYGAVQHPTTVFRQIHTLSPGAIRTIGAPHEASLSSLKSETTTYWKLPARDRAIDERRVVEQVRQLVDAAVCDHLVSDVPTGVFLSSGIDSTVMAGVAAKHASRLRSFTVGFADQPDLSELELARHTAGEFGLEHTEIQVTGRDALAATEAWAQVADLPSLDGLNVYVISMAVRRCGISVALSGQGGDELFGGYATFYDLPRFYGLLRKTRWMPPAVRSGLARVATMVKSAAIQQKAMGIARCNGDLLSLYFNRRRVMSNHELVGLGLMPGALGLTADYMPPEAIGGVANDDEDIFWSVSRLETQYYLGNTLLRVGDANGMAHSLEIRVPLLDQRLLDFALSLPGPVRMPWGSRGKYLLRLAFPELLRPAIHQQRKRGFEIPVRRWMGGPLRELCLSGLAAAKATGMFDTRQIDRIWRNYQQEPDSPAWARAFALSALGLYLRQHGAIN